MRFRADLGVAMIDLERLNDHSRQFATQLFRRWPEWLRYARFDPYEDFEKEAWSLREGPTAGSGVQGRGAPDSAEVGAPNEPSPGCRHADPPLSGRGCHGSQEQARRERRGGCLGDAPAGNGVAKRLGDGALTCWS